MQSKKPTSAQSLSFEHYSPHKLKRIISQEAFKSAHNVEFESLTERERQIFNLVVHNHTNAEIAQKLCISRKTVEQHRKNINRKLNAHTFPDIYNYALAFDVI
ncbi:hypothetical protein GCM10011506_20410 [Marivirga lumbricoides]|uniref:HTH luxR-type domain-containing protein n=1 Tax=Marivirga lumbricoides TaxID=1046115 RepID=A0A2T4DHN5_9BACT|nr:hypothetical protein C9994_13175 [Marivirga lumbricoides]GGC34963.1 hypothetical protein GCM10011506_20410 [Marivirga lumbricoides]